MIKKLHFIILFIIGVSTVLLGQKKDSLVNALDTAKGDKKVKLLNELFRANLLADPTKALAYAHEALALATEIGGHSSGAITGAMNTSGLLGGTVTSLGIGYLVSWTGSYDIPVIILALQLFVGAGFALLLKVKANT